MRTTHRFTLNSADGGGQLGWLPMAHTCFNRLDLPLFLKNKEELKDALNLVISMELTGFSID